MINLENTTCCRDTLYTFLMQLVYKNNVNKNSVQKQLMHIFNTASV